MVWPLPSTLIFTRVPSSSIGRMSAHAALNAIGGFMMKHCAGGSPTELSRRPEGGTGRWDRKVGPEGGTGRWDRKVRAAREDSSKRYSQHPFGPSHPMGFAMGLLGF